MVVVEQDVKPEIDTSEYIVDLPVSDRFNLNPFVQASLRHRKEQFGFGLLGTAVYYRTYSRQDPVTGKQERWADTVIRVVNGMFTIRKWHYIRNDIEWDEVHMQKVATKMANAIFDMKMLPPGRGLWAGGTEWTYQKGSAALNNCGYVEIRHLSEDAAWTMDMLMCGVGVGHNTQHFGTPKYYRPNPEKKNLYVIPDTREGWVESVRLLIESYEMGWYEVEFDYSQIRKEGEPIRGFGGTASGPKPLKALHGQVRGFLEQYRMGEISSVRLVADIMNCIGACVVAGNVRRSAEISLGDATSEEFINLKNYGWEEAVYVCENHGEFQERIPSWRLGEATETAKCPECGNKGAAVKDTIDGEEIHRKVYVEGPSYDRRSYGWMSNNSVIIDSYDDLRELPKLAERVQDNGEPGIFNLMNIQKYGRYGEKKPDKATGANPCAEIPLEDGELCNLVEVFPTRCVNEDGEFDERVFRETLQLATLYASSVSLLPTHLERTNKVVERNRRIGVSLSGIADWMVDHSTTDVIGWLDRGYKVVRNENERLAWDAGVPASVRVTTVKPSGTISLLAGVSSGMHLPPFSRYIRRVRIGETSPIVPILKEAGVPYEQDRASQNTLVFEFPVDQGKVRGQKDVSVWAKAQTVVMLQKFWADNMVSNTLSFDPEKEGDQIEDLLTLIVPFIKTISLLPLLDKGAVYDQSPIEQITLEEYKRRSKAIKEIDWNTFTGSDGIDSQFCANDSCEI